MPQCPSCKKMSYRLERHHAIIAKGAARQKTRKRKPELVDLMESDDNIIEICAERCHENHGGKMGHAGRFESAVMICLIDGFEAGVRRIKRVTAAYNEMMRVPFAELDFVDVENEVNRMLAERHEFK